MIIDYEHFSGTINLPQTGSSDGKKTIAPYINEFEEEFLKKALGYELWKVFAAGIEGSGTHDQRWIDLLEGKEFTYGSITDKWTGFESTPSPISQYVYYKFIENNISDTTTAGQALPKNTNAETVSPMRKMVDAWNKMVKLNQTLLSFLNANKDVYPEWIYRCTEVFVYQNHLGI